jgi:hypothetical protein
LPAAGSAKRSRTLTRDFVLCVFARSVCAEAVLLGRPVTARPPAAELAPTPAPDPALPGDEDDVRPEL